MDLVQVSLAPDGTVTFTCRVCQQHCEANDQVSLAVATREFLDMHPACADAAQHDEGCPEELAEA